MLVEFYHAEDDEESFVTYSWEAAPSRGDTVWLPPEPDYDERLPLDKFEVIRVEWQPHQRGLAAAICVAKVSEAGADK